MLVAAVVLAVPSAVAGYAALPSEAAAAPAAGVTYQLAVTKSGMCADVTAGSKENSALLQQWGCTPSATWQQFTLVAVGSVYQVKNVNSGKCIDVPDHSTTSGVQLQQYTCVSSQTNQQWRLTASGTGTYQIVGVGSGLCVTDKGASTSSGAAIIQETCSANSNKQWAFTPVTGGTTPPAGSLTVAKDGTGQYSTVQAAVDAVPANNTIRKTIAIKAGTYRESVVIPSNKPFITFQGLGSAPSATVIVNNKPASTAGTTGSATVYVQAKEFNATNLTFNNDYDETVAASQALALALYGDRAVLKNVRVTADQDTLLIYNSARAYIANSYIEGTVDFIYGNGSAVFHACTIYEKRSTGGPITAANTPAAQTYGFLIYQSTITGATADTTQLGRPWGQGAQVTYRESSLSATIATAQPWVNMSTNTWQNARFYEYKNTGAGATVNSNRTQLTDAQAANYTPQKYLAGTDAWNPVG
ncbi:hypothetical protein Apa02nite_056300 [Actinoplanes palleronii]|uniref:Ricin B lectin domain-containing protein n=1 Tax=Actinoplanes palleronii TaxID=113570 RepID=A0ABQ4BG02_9ACTN|nr:hypothetical protein Apa02nite_056300 [Actinoplanes palleronii]